MRKFIEIIRRLDENTMTDLADKTLLWSNRDTIRKAELWMRQPEKATPAQWTYRRRGSEVVYDDIRAKLDRLVSRLHNCPPVILELRNWFFNPHADRGSTLLFPPMPNNYDAMRALFRDLDEWNKSINS